MTSKKKILISMILIGLIGAGLFFGISTYTKNQQKAQALKAEELKPKKHILNIQAHDISLVQQESFAQKLPISGVFKPTQEIQIKAKNFGDIIGLNLKSGDYVKAGQIIARIRNTDVQSRLQQSDAQINVVKEQLKLADIQYRKQLELMQEGVISKNALDTYKTSLDIAKANLNSAQAAKQISVKSVNDSVVIAPFSGVVATTYIQNGEKVNIDTPILHLVNTQTLELEAGVNANDINKVNIGQSVNVDIEGLDAQAQQITGKIIRIAPASNNSSRLVNVYIKIDNNNTHGNMIKAGIFAKADVILHTQDMLAIDEASIQRLPSGQSFVYEVKDNKLHKVSIKESAYKNASKIGIENIDLGASIVNIPLSLDKPMADIIVNIVK
jgi:RND family efflux transporter MFP subunit